MYSSVILIFFLLKSRVTPNMVTIVYGLCGIIGCVFLTIPNINYNIAGIIIFFNKSIFDWSDGYLARIKYKTTLKGHILDSYGAHLNSIGFNVGLGFFVLNQTGYDVLIYLIVSIPFLYFGIPILLGKNLILDELRKNKIKDIFTKHNISNAGKKSNRKHNKKNNKIKYPKWMYYFRGFMDDRARTVDFILFTMIIDIYLNYNFSFYLFLIWYIKHLFRFFLLTYSGINSAWDERAIIEIKKINNGKKK